MWRVLQTHLRHCHLSWQRRFIAGTQREGIPEKVPSDRPTRFASVPPVGKPRDPNVRIYVDNDRFRIVHEHKRNGRGPLDRTITATTLEKMYADAVASDQCEVVLR